MRPTSQEILALTRRSFPWLIRSDAEILAILDAPGNHVGARWEDGALVGACVARGETVYLLCVEEKRRGRGIGGQLLAEAEAVLRERGAKSVQVGVGESYITPGVPMLGGAEDFFRRRGYRHDWGETGCFDMECDVAHLPRFEARVGLEQDGVLYRLATPEDRPLVLDCVRAGYEEFARYYEPLSHYDPQSPKPILLAEEGGRAVGCILIDLGTVEPGLGNVGCTVTREECRNRGIATRMVQAATRYLLERGMRRAALQYTYTDILRMYGRAGYRVSMEYFMAKKEL